MKFTFIMPIYNSEDILYKSINSIKNQTYKNWELIAVDDGSTDNTYKELKKIALKDKRIKIFSSGDSVFKFLQASIALSIAFPKMTPIS